MRRLYNNVIVWTAYKLAGLGVFITGISVKMLNSVYPINIVRTNYTFCEYPNNTTINSSPSWEIRSPFTRQNNINQIWNTPLSSNDSWTEWTNEPQDEEREDG